MITPKDSRFWQAAVRSGLLDEPALQDAWDAIHPSKRTYEAIDRRLARLLVNTGVLTLWQAQQILAGRWQGLRIDKYELKDVIGQGGMGRVYLARDVRLDRKVALKILSRERMNNERALARFRREAKVGAQLQHENLVRIYDEGEAYGVRYLVMEYIEGKTVGRLISELGALPPSSAADIARKVALGLDHLHQKDLLHRDVNPMNILIDRDGTAKLTDLGLAIDLGDEDVVTRDGATVGTFDYISPEQAKHSRMVDPRADIYSLGCTLYHMISGRVPFPTPSLPEKLYAHQLSEPEPLSKFTPEVPEGLAAVVSKMMRKLPEDRYRRASDVAKALEPFATHALSASRLTSGLSSTQEATAVHAIPPVKASPMGSDPDLAYQPAPPGANSPSAPTPDPLDFALKINLGPELSLSGSRSGVRSKSRSAETGGSSLWNRRLLWGALVGAVTAGLSAGGFWIWKASGTGTTRSPGEVEGTNKAASAESTGSADIVIRFANGDEQAQPTLRMAIQRLSGSGGEILIRSKRILREGDAGQTLRLAGGHLVIKAADGVRAEILVELSGPAPWLEISSNARLTLSGLALRTESLLLPQAAAAPAVPPTLIAADGNVAFDRCTFSTTGRDRSVRALVARGLDTRITGCSFEGFDQAVALVAYPGSHTRLSQTIFLRDRLNPLAGWALSSTRSVTVGSVPAKLTMDRCTVVGSGLLAAELFQPDSPLSVSVTNSAIQTSTLLMTAIPRDKLKSSIVWTGRENLYAISSLPWVVLSPKGFDSIPGGPTDFKGWTELFPNDTESDSQAIPFSSKNVSEGHGIENMAVKVEDGKPPLGADPAQVGPAVKL